MRLIDADALYEKTAEWEARALAVIEKLNRKPFEEMDANEITEWRKWSCILNERSAFKHDVADAPTVETQQWIPVTKRLPENDTIVLVTFSCGKVGTSSWHESTKFNNGFDNYMNGIYEDGTTEMYGVVAWMPLPEPFREGGAEECH